MEITAYINDIVEQFRRLICRSMKRRSRKKSNTNHEKHRQESSFVIHRIYPPAILKKLFRNEFGNIKSLEKNYQGQDLSCQGSVQCTDLHALDSNKRNTFHSRVREKGFFHHPLKLFLTSIKSVLLLFTHYVKY